MPIQVPKDRAYYYEITALRERLYCWLPVQDLKKMVRSRKVKKNILKDYPDGLDVEVTKGQLEEFQENYDLDLGIDGNYIRAAFNAIRLKREKTFPRSGFIERKFLENMAESIKKSGTFPYGEKSAARLEKDKKRYKKFKDLNRKSSLFLRKFQVAGLDRHRPMQEQTFSKIKMTKGKDAFEVFSKLHQRIRKGG